jgi:hypothetical protein
MVQNGVRRKQSVASVAGGEVSVWMDDSPKAVKWKSGYRNIITIYRCIVKFSMICWRDSGTRVEGKARGDFHGHLGNNMKRFAT